MTIYAVGDIHGQIEMLTWALDLIKADGGDDAEIVFLGDLVDRGANSRKVIELLMSGQADGKRWHVLKGNHDRIFERFVDHGFQYDPRIKSGLGWLDRRMGGIETLASYGVTGAQDPATDEVQQAARAAVPQAHLDFLQAMPLWLQRGELLFVHAGIRPGVPLEQQTEEDLIWIREPFLIEALPHPWLIVHGHTALDYPQHFGNRIDLDGGAGYGRPIIPAVFEGRNCWLLGDQGREALLP